MHFVYNLKKRYVFVAQKQPQWLAMLNIFEYTTWILVFVVFVMTAVTWNILGRAMPEGNAHKNVVICILNSWCVFLGISANNRPNLTPLRILYIAFTLYSINMTTVYTSKLINVFKNPSVENQIDTIEEIIDSNLPIGNFY